MSIRGENGETCGALLNGQFFRSALDGEEEEGERRRREELQRHNVGTTTTGGFPLIFPRNNAELAVIRALGMQWGTAFWQ